MEKKQKVVLLTGAAGGLGTEIARFLHAEGYVLALNYMQSTPELAEADNVKHFQADLRYPSEIDNMISAIVATFGRIDILINNAGISRNAMAWKASLEDWNDTLATNLTAPFLLGKSVIPYMRKSNWGRIINISSIVAQTGFIGTSAYAATKAGLNGLTKTWSKELAPFGITVNSIAPGYFNTGMIHEVPEDIQQELICSIPVQKLGEPSSINATLQFILHDDADYLTGQTIHLNGGMY